MDLHLVCTYFSSGSLSAHYHDSPSGPLPIRHHSLLSTTAYPNANLSICLRLCLCLYRCLYLYLCLCLSLCLSLSLILCLCLSLSVSVSVSVSLSLSDSFFPSFSLHPSSPPFVSGLAPLSVYPNNKSTSSPTPPLSHILRPPYLTHPHILTRTRRHIRHGRRHIRHGSLTLSQKIKWSLARKNSGKATHGTTPPPNPY